MKRIFIFQMLLVAAGIFTFSVMVAYGQWQPGQAPCPPPCVPVAPPQPLPSYMPPGYQAPPSPTLMDFTREYMRDLDATTREAQRWNQADEALGAERARRMNCLLGRGHVDNCGG